jgi:hypothetical protein
MVRSNPWGSISREKPHAALQHIIFDNTIQESLRILAMRFTNH